MFPTISLLLVSLTLPVEPTPRFEAVGARSGIRFRHVCGSAEKDWIYEVNGSGVALFDHDGDGDLDLYLVNGSRLEPTADATPPRNALYRNEGNWKFTDVTRTAGVGDEGWGCAVAVADVDGNGHPDLYVTNLGPNVLYLNRGDGTFERQSRSGTEDPGNGTSASFADFDGDGRLDLFVTNYVPFELDPMRSRQAGRCEYKGRKIFCGPGGYEGQADRLYLQRESGRFEDVSQAWGVLEPSPAFGLGSRVIDVLGDGRPDIFVANDTQPNHVFLLQGGGRFRETGAFLGLAYNDHGIAQASMGMAAGDFRGVGLEDLFVTHFEDDTNTLYLARRGDPFFDDGTHRAGLGGPGYPFLGWGACALDVEGDGDLDLFVANGHVAPQVEGVRESRGYHQRNQLFLNDGRGKFREYSPRGEPDGLSIEKSSRGAATGDLDGDGDPDLVVSNIDDGITLLENHSGERHWLAVTLRGSGKNTSAVGAHVVLEEPGKSQHRWIRAGTSYASQCELAARFARQSPSEPGRLVVRWPSGLVETFPLTSSTEAGNTRKALREGDGSPSPGPPKKR